MLSVVISHYISFIEHKKCKSYLCDYLQQIYLMLKIPLTRSEQSNLPWDWNYAFVSIIILKFIKGNWQIWLCLCIKILKIYLEYRHTCALRRLLKLYLKIMCILCFRLVLIWCSFFSSNQVRKLQNEHLCCTWKVPHFELPVDLQITFLY